MRRAAAALFLLGAVLAPSPARAAPPALLVAGKPRLGQALRFEVTADPGRLVYLLFDAVPGPAQAGGVTFGVGLSPALVVWPLGVAAGLPLVFQPTVPSLPALDGAVFYVEAVTDAFEVSGAEAVPLAAAASPSSPPPRSRASGPPPSRTASASPTCPSARRKTTAGTGRSSTLPSSSVRTPTGRATSRSSSGGRSGRR